MGTFKNKRVPETIKEEESTDQSGNLGAIVFIKDPSFLSEIDFSGLTSKKYKFKDIRISECQ